MKPEDTMKRIRIYRMSKNTKETGALGEQIAAKYLKEKGFDIVESNYWRKWGEIDLIVRRDQIIRFVEVKTVSYETVAKLKHAVTHETWNPEELVHKFKIRQIQKALQTWISDNRYTGNWQIDVIAIRIVPRETFASVKWIENIIEE